MRDHHSNNSIACLECRQRHLKCGGETPSCLRCVNAFSTCTYIASRRGQGPRRRHARPSRASTATDSGLGTEFSTPSQCSTSLSPCDAVGNRLPPAGVVQNTQAPSTFSLGDAERKHFKNLYYSHFHPAHPILRPQAFAFSAGSCYLDLIVCFIGHRYDVARSEIVGMHAAVELAMSPPDELTASRMQALTLYAIVLHSDQKYDAAEASIARACQIASGLNIVHATSNSGSAEADAIGIESLRRSWWELYIIDTYLAALHRRPKSMDQDDSTQPWLPCREALYETGYCNVVPVSLRTLKHRRFAPYEHTRFSSYSYRIEAVSILARVLGLSLGKANGADDVEAVDHAISAWKLDVSDLNANDSDFSPHTDEMMFQARLFIQCASILLHFPRSDLSMTVPTLADLSCAEGCVKLAPTSNLHTAKAALASKEIADLVALPCSLERHSPLFSCGVILACMIQLAAAFARCQTSGASSLQHYEDRTALLLGAMTILSRRWPVARTGAQRLKTVASAIFAEPETPDRPGSSSIHDSGIDMEEFPSNMSWFDLLSPAELSDALQRLDDDLNGQNLFSSTALV